MPDTIIKTDIEGKPFAIHLTKSAVKNLDSSNSQLNIRMELYFSCFVKKIVSFSEDQEFPNATKVKENILVSFRPVQSKSCDVRDLEGDYGPSLIDLPVVKRNAIIPGHLFIDHNKKGWKGDFTWKIHK